MTADPPASWRAGLRAAAHLECHAGIELNPFTDACAERNVSVNYWPISGDEQPLSSSLPGRARHRAVLGRCGAAARRVAHTSAAISCAA